MLKRIAPLAVAVGVLITAPAAADWQQDVTAQIATEEECVVTFFSQTVERRIDGKEVVIAKAHCEDQRAFDVYREGARGPFTIKECGVVEKIEC